MNKPKISVIIPTYNRAHMLTKAITSVFNQKYINIDFEIEMIIIDDGSTDNTKYKIKQILSEHSIDKKYVQYYQFNQNFGIPRALNKGYEMATGNFVCQLSSDDWWDEEKIFKQLKIMEKNPTCGIIYSNYYFVDLDNNNSQRKCNVFSSDKKYPENLKEMCGRLFSDCFMNFCTYMMRKEFLKEIGNYSLRPEFEWNQDLHQAFKFVFNKNWNIIHMSDYLAYITIHSQQASKQGKCGLGNDILLPEMAQQAKLFGLL